MACPVCILVPRSPLISPSLNTSPHRGARAGLKKQGGRYRGAHHCRARGRLAPTLPGGAEQDLALEEMVELKLKGKPDYLLPSSTAPALRGWRCLVHSQPGRCQGLEKRPPVPGAAGATTAPPGPPGPRQCCSGFPGHGWPHQRGRNRSKGICGFPSQGTASPPPSQHPHTGPPAAPSTHTWAHPQQTKAPLQGSTSGNETDYDVVYPPGPLKMRRKGLCGCSAQLGVQRKRLPRLGPLGAIPEAKRRGNLAQEQHWRLPEPFAVSEPNQSIHRQPHDGRSGPRPTLPLLPLQGPFVDTGAGWGAP